MASQAPSCNDDNGDKKPPPHEEAPKKRAGYECEFVEPPQEQFQSECPICLQILREPYIVDCCGYSFCAACIERVGEDGKPCPHCNQPGYTTLINKGLKRALNEFRVYCSHHGCGWVGELRKLDAHLNSDPQPERRLDGCQFTVIECLHCKEGICRDKIADHQLERCPQRPYTCEYCAEYKSTFDDVAHCHWPECKCFLLPCPNNCTPSGSEIERQHLAKHVKEECPMMVVQCELHHAGCEVMLLRKNMEDHMKENLIAHISLLAAENHNLSKRLLQTEEQIILLTRVTQELTELKQKLTEKVNFQSQELIRTHQELMQRVTFQSQEVSRVKTDLNETLRQAIDRLQTQQQCDLRELRTNVEMRRDIAPVTIKMAEFDELKKKSTTWLSRPFYTGRGGYKVCLSVDANGDGTGKGTHVSVFTCLMRGEFDSHLKWPFRGNVTIQLVNQLEDKEHRTQTYEYTDTTPDGCAACVTDGGRSLHVWGKHKFIQHTKLGLSVTNNRQYLKDDCLIFRIVSGKLQ